ncbi:ATP-binding protein [Candidatus Woesearchaeota archaeon]|nr:MAG: ATP-binding protein [Candidatus Woesearchaeota archaeon]
MGFVHDWQKKLGYKKDPFTAEPSPRVHDYLVGREKEREQLNLFCIKQDRFGIIHAPAGMGKSTLLLWLRAEMKRRALLVSGRATHEQVQDAFLLRGFGMLGRVTKSYEKLTPQQRDERIIERVGKTPLLILIDDANELAKESKELMKRLLTLPKTQVILALERVLKEHESFGEDRLGLELKPLPPAVLTLLLARRIALAGGVGVFPFSDEDLRELTKAKTIPLLLERARERAIELSLKVEGPPKKTREEAPQKKRKPAEQVSTGTLTTQQESAPADTEKKRFAIKFVRRKEGGIVIGARREEHLSDTTETVPADDIDAHLLNDIVAGDTVKRSESVTVNQQTTEIRDVIEELVEEIGGEK